MKHPQSVCPGDAIKMPRTTIAKHIYSEAFFSRTGHRALGWTLQTEILGGNQLANSCLQILLYYLNLYYDKHYSSLIVDKINHIKQ